ncbi:MAG: cell division protein FtsQ/DivIB [Candidatus Bruticola sp.]
MSSMHLPSNYSVRLVSRVILIIFFCLAQGVFLLSPVFKISQIRVEGNNLFSNDEIISQSPYKVGLYYWASLLNSGTHPLKDPAILENSISLERRGLVVIKVKERTPVVLVSSEHDPIYWLLTDSEGCILSKERPGFSNLPRLKVDFIIPKLGQMNNALISVVLRAAHEIEKALSIKPIYYAIDSIQSISICIDFLDHETLIKIGNLDNLNIKLEIVRTLLDQFRMKNKKIDIIDVRFKNVFIKEYEISPKLPSSNLDGKSVPYDSAVEEVRAADNNNSDGAENNTDNAAVDRGVYEDSLSKPAVDTAFEDNNPDSAAESVSDDSSEVPAADYETVEPQSVNIGLNDGDREAADDVELHVNGGGVGEAISVP